MVADVHLRRGPEVPERGRARARTRPPSRRSPTADCWCGFPPPTPYAATRCSPLRSSASLSASATRSRATGACASRSNRSRRTTAFSCTAGAGTVCRRASCRARFGSASRRRGCWRGTGTRAVCSTCAAGRGCGSTRAESLPRVASWARAWSSSRTSSTSAHEIASRPLPRALLADEVGLGKTIEAGLVLHRLLRSGQGFPGAGPRARAPGTSVVRGAAAAVPSVVHDRQRVLCRGRSRFGCRRESFSWRRRPRSRASTGSPMRMRPTPRSARRPGTSWSSTRRTTSSGTARPIDCWRRSRRPRRACCSSRRLRSSSAKRAITARLRLLDPDRYSSYERYREDAEGFRETARLAGRLLDGEPVTSDEAGELASLLPERASLARRLVEPSAVSEVGAAVARERSHRPAWPRPGHVPELEKRPRPRSRARGPWPRPRVAGGARGSLCAARGRVPRRHERRPSRRRLRLLGRRTGLVARRAPPLDRAGEGAGPVPLQGEGRRAPRSHARASRPAGRGVPTKTSRSCNATGTRRGSPRTTRTVRRCSCAPRSAARDATSSSRITSSCSTCR